MLRITRSMTPDQARLIRLEGKLFAPWVELVESATREVVDSGGRVVLDLAAVSFVDEAGARLLADLVRRGTVVEGCSNFVAAILREEARS